MPNRIAGLNFVCKRGDGQLHIATVQKPASSFIYYPPNITDDKFYNHDSHPTSLVEFNQSTGRNFILTDPSFSVQSRLFRFIMDQYRSFQVTPNKNCYGPNDMQHTAAACVTYLDSSRRLE
uniref:Uncharacterized protein n=1 Tax=Romanomermis culicivorax TaxID=13658 RepID=A0A915IIE6_ROMCU